MIFTATSLPLSRWTPKKISIEDADKEYYQTNYDKLQQVTTTHYNTTNYKWPQQTTTQQTTSDYNKLQQTTTQQTTSDYNKLRHNKLQVTTTQQTTTPNLESANGKAHLRKQFQTGLNREFRLGKPDMNDWYPARGQMLLRDLALHMAPLSSLVVWRVYVLCSMYIYIYFFSNQIKVILFVKEALSVLMLCAPVFIFASGSSALLGRPCCGLSIWLSLLAIFNTLFWVYVNFFHEKTNKTRKTLEVRHFRMIRKWPPTVTRRAKH